MIHRLYSTLPGFKTLAFHKGMNLLLADKSPGATDRQTRNGAGKSSVLEIVHFILGSNVDEGSIFSDDKLISHSFGMDFDLNGVRIQIERTSSEKNEIFVASGDTSKWPVTTQTDKATGKRFMPLDDWRKILGNQMFGLEYSRRGTSFVPSFRSLFSYFARRVGEGGMLEPQKHYADQTISDRQINLMFLLDLDWTLAKEWEVTRQKEKMLRSLKKIVKAGGLDGILDKASHLRTELVVAEDRVNRLKKSLKEFNVLPGYRDMEQDASRLASEIARLSNENVLDRELISDVERSLKEEQAPSFTHLESIYAEIGVIMPENVKHRFEEVREFHVGLITNRKNYLGQELSDAKIRISGRDSELSRASGRQSEIMSLLKSHGALDQFNKLHSELSKHEAYAESVRTKLGAAEQIESKQNELDIRRAQLKARLTQDLAERRTSVNRAFVTFADLSSSLYEKPGSLTIDPTDNGPNFDITIQGHKSRGKNNMQIFCFDMTIMMLCKQRNLGPGFLMHDSHLFDGVDERQIAKALQIGEKMADDLAFQYIVTMNSDVSESCLEQEFIDKHVVLPRLTDATDDGGLFGIRF